MNKKISKAGSMIAVMLLSLLWAFWRHENNLPFWSDNDNSDSIMKFIAFLSIGGFIIGGIGQNIIWLVKQGSNNEDIDSGIFSIIAGMVSLHFVNAEENIDKWNVEGWITFFTVALLILGLIDIIVLRTKLSSNESSDSDSSHPDSARWLCSCGTLNYWNHCTNCGKEKPSVVCKKCGWIPKPDEEKLKYCPKCGTQLLDDDGEILKS